MSQVIEQAQVVPNPPIDPKAIATLMNRHLTPQGIAAQVVTFGETLQVLLEGIDLPQQAPMTKFVTAGLQKMGTPGITQLQVFGKRTGDAQTAWVEVFASEETAWSTIETPAEVTFGTGDIKLQARQGQTDAIAQFVEEVIQDLMANTGDRIKDETTEAAPIESFIHLDEAGLLNVTIQTAQFLDGPAFAAQFGLRMNEIASNAVREVALFKRKNAEASPFLIKQMTLHRTK
jgi:hypothetical protein